MYLAAWIWCLGTSDASNIARTLRILSMHRCFAIVARAHMRLFDSAACYCDFLSECSDNLCPALSFLHPHVRVNAP